jgi:hypothetical protein
MPLTRSEIIGYDQKAMVYRFLMMHGNQPIDCSVKHRSVQAFRKKQVPVRQHGRSVSPLAGDNREGDIGQI